MSDGISKMSAEGRIRKDILDAALSAGKTGAHIAPSLSLAEICLAVLRKMKSCDQFVLSKGHGALGYYAAMHQMGLVTDQQFASFEENGGDFPGQPSRSGKNGISYSGGSLGMGLSYAVGRAYAGREKRIFVVLGDGELDEGSIWEAAGAARRLGLGNVTAVVDHNGLQSDGKLEDVMGNDLTALWRAYGWNMMECDGHSVQELEQCIENACSESTRPSVILAETIKGKGVSFMEGNNEWHHHELKQEEYERALAEIGERYGLH